LCGASWNTADRKTKITEVSTETAEKCTVDCEMQ